jgi:1,4-dihydroxy-2-naphthoate octaprenyltransferase
VNRWLVAARPPTLLASAAPVLVGAGLALGDGAFRPDAFVVTLITAVLLNIAVNFANDASDAHRGADGPGRIGPQRVVASGAHRPPGVDRTAVVLAIATAGASTSPGSRWVVIATAPPPSWRCRIHRAPAVWILGSRRGVRVRLFGLAAVTGSRYAHDAHVSAALAAGDRSGSW